MADSDGKDKRGRCQKIGDGFSNFAKFLFNKETGQVMGRSGESWLKIGAFYLIFYGFLAAFFSAMLTVFLTTLNDPGKGAPKLVQFLENKPGLSLVASLNFDYKAEKYNATRDTIIKEYVGKVDTFLGKYAKIGDQLCKGSDISGMKEDKDCRFDTNLLGNCKPGDNTTYGLDEGKPCVFVKINKVFGWVPKADPKEDEKYLLLKCKDPKNPKVDINVEPAGFLIAAFPFRGQGPEFELPVVAVQMKVAEYKSVECYLKGKDIETSESYIPHRAFSKIRIS